MKLLDKIWNILGLVESEEPEPPDLKPLDKTVSRMERKAERPVRAIEENKPRRNLLPEPAKPVSDIPDKQALLPPGDKGAMVISQPLGFDDARQIAENLTNGRTVVVNFESADAETTKRTVDFMSGITYAVGGSVQRVSGSVFLFAPSFVEITSNDRLTEDGHGALPWNRS